MTNIFNPIKFEKLKETMNGMTDFSKNLGEDENNEVPIARSFSVFPIGPKKERYCTADE
jgi:hypothetical protein